MRVTGLIKPMCMLAALIVTCTGNASEVSYQGSLTQGALHKTNDKETADVYSEA